MSAVETARLGLARMIASGELTTGDLLPSEAELCDRFGVSRSSLREAQKMLSVAGALDARPGSRPTVSLMRADQIMAGLKMVVPLLPLHRFLDLFPLREVLEGHVAALSAARLPDDKVDRLMELAIELRDEPPNDRAQTLDADFHGIIIRGAEDEVIASLLSAIRRRGQDYRIFEMAHGTELKEISDAAHLQLAQAIRDRDPESARFLAMHHVRETRIWLEGLQPGPIVFEESGT